MLLNAELVIKPTDYWPLCHFFPTSLSFYFSLYPSHSKNMRQHFPKEIETVLKGIVVKQVYRP